MIRVVTRCCLLGVLFYQAFVAPGAPATVPDLPNGARTQWVVEEPEEIVSYLAFDPAGVRPRLPAGLRFISIREFAAGGVGVGQGFPCAVPASRHGASPSRVRSHADLRHRRTCARMATEGRRRIWLARVAPSEPTAESRSRPAISDPRLLGFPTEPMPTTCGERATTRPMATRRSSAAQRGVGGTPGSRGTRHHRRLPADGARHRGSRSADAGLLPAGLISHRRRRPRRVRRAPRAGVRDGARLLDVPWATPAREQHRPGCADVPVRIPPEGRHVSTSTPVTEARRPSHVRIRSAPGEDRWCAAALTRPEPLRQSPQAGRDNPARRSHPRRLQESDGASTDVPAPHQLGAASSRGRLPAAEPA